MNNKNNGTITAYPLSWPANWPRTDRYKITRSRYGDRSLAAARDAINDQIRLLRGRDIVISSNLELRNDGLPRSGQRQPVDRGVAVYFEYKGKPMCFACDRWDAIEDNLWAVNLTIEAIRQIERAGSSDMMERAFRGFDALPAPAGAMWWEVLEVAQDADPDTIRSAYLAKAKVHHPDAGGDAEKFQEIVAAFNASSV